MRGPLVDLCTNLITPVMYACPAFPVPFIPIKWCFGQPAFFIQYFMTFLNNLVPRALFPTSKAREKRPGDEVAF